MAEPRFSVGSVQGGTKSKGGDPTWTVHDRFYSYRVVAAFWGGRDEPEVEARAYAANANAKHDLWVTGLCDPKRRNV